MLLLHFLCVVGVFFFGVLLMLFCVPSVFVWLWCCWCFFFAGYCSSVCVLLLVLFTCRCCLFVCGWCFFWACCWCFLLLCAFLFCSHLHLRPHLPLALALAPSPHSHLHTHIYTHAHTHTHMYAHIYQVLRFFSGCGFGLVSVRVCLFERS